jgi:ubiquinol-cytochrome c reductase cytochrome b subunit
MKALLQWLDTQTGLPTRVRGFLNHRLAGGPRWRHSLYAALLFAFAIQVITGYSLWTGYSPSTQTAWESVHHLQYETTGGLLLRGLHHASAQLVMVLLAACIGLTILTRAFRSPHIAGYWLLLTAVPIAVGMSVTGWLLPFDQNGYWAARVPLNILSIIPVIGPTLQTLLIGGPDVGHHTLTRFLALHAGLLPVCLAVVLYAASRLIRRATPQDPHPSTSSPWWPEQAWRDALCCAGVLAVALLMALKAHDHPGAPLRAPADLSESYSAARPEWFFLFLFQFLKFFPGGTEIIGAIIIPTLLMAFLAAMPFIERKRRGHALNLAVLAILASGIAVLTSMALLQDRRDPAHHAALAQAGLDAARVRELIQVQGIPPTGAAALLRNDPATQGPKLFARQCASCHRYDGHDGLGGTPSDPASAPDLKGFASREWLAKVLDPATFTGPHFFGNTKHKDGKMAKFLNRDVAAYDATLKANLVKVIAAVSAEAALPSQSKLDEKDAAQIEEGRKLAASSEMRCAECHQFRKKDEDATAPDLTGYGSREWLVGIISDPSHDRFYGRRNDRMPAFAKDQVLDERSVGLLADWLRGDVPRASGK